MRAGVGSVGNSGCPHFWGRCGTPGFRSEVWKPPVNLELCFCQSGFWPVLRWIYALLPFPDLRNGAAGGIDVVLEGAAGVVET
jgi:hypothetical protein